MKIFKVHPVGVIRNNQDNVCIELESVYIPGLSGLEGFSHLNILWWFSECDSEEARTILTAPQPYKKSPEVMGVFATRSPLRPNPIALTTVEIVRVDYQKGIIEIPYTDANDGTPVLDIKPYTPSLDRVQSPRTPEWCSHWPKSLEDSASFEWENEFNF